MWLIAAGVGVAAVAGLVAFVMVESPRDEQRARSEAAAEQLAGWVRQAGFEPAGIEGDLDPASDTVATSEEPARRAPRVRLTVEQLPITVSWDAPPPGGVAPADGIDRFDVGDRTVEIGDAAPRQGRAFAWFDCGPTSLRALVDTQGVLEAEDLPPDGGQAAVVAVITGLVETVPCPVGHPSTSQPGTEISHDPSVTLEQPVVTDAFVRHPTRLRST